MAVDLRIARPDRLVQLKQIAVGITEKDAICLRFFGWKARRPTFKILLANSRLRRSFSTRARRRDVGRLRLPTNPLFSGASAPEPPLLAVRQQYLSSLTPRSISSATARSIWS
jgi:hypothetical protein